MLIDRSDIDEQSDQVWLADFTTDMMNEGTTSRTASQIAQDAAAMGGRLSVSAGLDLSNVQTEVLSERAADAVRLVADVAQHPLFPASELAVCAYMKVTTGSVDDWPALGVAVVIEGDANTARSVRIVASAATEKATRLKSAEAVLSGNRMDDRLIRRAADAAAEEAELVSDVRGSVPYKSELMRVYVQRAVRAALDGSGAH